MLKSYIEIIGNDKEEEISELLNSVDIDYKFVDIGHIIEMIYTQQNTINNLEDRIGDLATEICDKEEESIAVKNKLRDLLLPSSRTPPYHFKLPDERPSITHEFTIGDSFGHGTITVGLYPGSSDVGEIFVRMKSTVVPDHEDISKLKNQVADLINCLRGMINQLAIAVSIGLQRGIPLDVFVRKFKNTSFPPAGVTSNSRIRMCLSIVDYLFRWLELKFVKKGDL